MALDVHYYMPWYKEGPGMEYCSCYQGMGEVRRRACVDPVDGPH